MLASVDPHVCHSDPVGTSMTRATIIWFVGAAVVGAIAGGLHVLRSDIGGGHTGMPLAVGAYALTGLAALMLYHGVVVAAREQDAAAGPESRDLDEPVVREAPEGAPEGAPEVALGGEARDTAYDETSDSGPADNPTVYTFRRGKPVVDRSRRPAGRD